MTDKSISPIRMIEEISEGYLFNPKRGKLFDDICDHEFVCSEVEVDQLALSLRQKMTTALEAV